MSHLRRSLLQAWRSEVVPNGEGRLFGMAACRRDRTMWMPIQASPCVSRSVAERGIRVLVQEVPQHRDKLPSMRNIVLPNGRADIVHQHVSDLFASVLALEQAVAKHGSDALGDMLVLGYGLNFIRREVT